MCCSIRPGVKAKPKLTFKGRTHGVIATAIIYRNKSFFKDFNISVHMVVLQYRH